MIHKPKKCTINKHKFSSSKFAMLLFRFESDKTYSISLIPSSLIHQTMERLHEILVGACWFFVWLEYLIVILSGQNKRFMFHVTRPTLTKISRPEPLFRCLRKKYKWAKFCKHFFKEKCYKRQNVDHLTLFLVFFFSF